MMSCTANIWQWPNTFKGHSMVIPKYSQCWLVDMKTWYISFEFRHIWHVTSISNSPRGDMWSCFFSVNQGCIAWVLHRRCVGVAWAVQSNHCSAQLPPAHSVWPTQLSCGPRICARPRIWRPVHFSCNSCILHGPAHFTAHALTSWSMQFATFSFCEQGKSKPTQSKANTISQCKFRMNTTY